MRAVCWHSPLNENLGGATKPDRGTFETNSVCGEIEENEPVLAKGNSPFGMPNDLEEELTVSPSITQVSRGQPSNRHPQRMKGLAPKARS